MAGMVEGKVAVVTGAGGGIGREIAIAMARAGAKVVVNDVGASLSGEGLSATPAEETKRLIEQTGGELQDVFISELRDHTYYAKLRIRQNGELNEVDCRPSDAIAMAVTVKVPIYVSEDVLGEVCAE